MKALCNHNLDFWMKRPYISLEKILCREVKCVFQLVWRPIKVKQLQNTMCNKSYIYPSHTHTLSRSEQVATFWTLPKSLHKVNKLILHCDYQLKLTIWTKRAAENLSVKRIIVVWLGIRKHERTTGPPLSCDCICLFLHFTEVFLLIMNTVSNIEYK